MRADGLSGLQSVRAGLLPSPRAGLIPAYETVVYDEVAGDLESYRLIVDARNGRVLLRQSTVDHAADNPAWKVFPSYPLGGLNRYPWNYPSTDIRVLWCWTPGPACDLAVSTGSPHPGVPWDTVPPGGPTFTTTGNNNLGQERWGNPARHAGRHTCTDLPTDEPDARLRLSVDERLVHVEVRSGELRPGQRERHRRRDREPLRDAQPDARLDVPPRLRRGALELPDGSRRADAAAVEPGRHANRPRGSADRQRPGAGHQRRLPELRRPRQRQHGHPARRPELDHEHVPLAVAGRRLLRPVRGRRLRHVGHRPRVRAHGREPDDRQGHPAAGTTTPAPWASRSAT